jgi:hypothetical protein
LVKVLQRIVKCFVKLIAKFDWFNLLKIKQLRNTEHLNSISGIVQNLAEKQMATFNGKWNYGFISIYLIFLRLPLFLVFVQILFILKISKLGQILSDSTFQI